MGTRRGRGVQFPFAVTDRVIIKVRNKPNSYLVPILLHVETNIATKNGSGEQEDTAAFRGT